MSTQEHLGRKLIVPVSIGFFVLQAVGTVTAILNKLPHEVGGYGDPNNVAMDFFMGGGTALSGPFVVLVILAILIVLGRRSDRWGTLGLAVTIILGAMAAALGAQEPILARMLRASPFGLFEASVLAQGLGSILAISGIVVLSLLQAIATLSPRAKTA